MQRKCVNGPFSLIYPFDLSNTSRVAFVIFAWVSKDLLSIIDYFEYFKIFHFLNKIVSSTQTILFSIWFKNFDEFSSVVYTNIGICYSVSSIRSNHEHFHQNVGSKWILIHTKKRKKEWKISCRFIDFIIQHWLLVNSLRISEYHSTTISSAI